MKRVLFLGLMLAFLVGMTIVLPPARPTVVDNDVGTTYEVSQSEFTVVADFAIETPVTQGFNRWLLSNNLYKEEFPGSVLCFQRPTYKINLVNEASRQIDCLAAINDMPKAKWGYRPDIGEIKSEFILI